MILAQEMKTCKRLKFDEKKKVKCKNQKENKLSTSLLQNKDNSMPPQVTAFTQYLQPIKAVIIN